MIDLQYLLDSVSTTVEPRKEVQVKEMKEEKALKEWDLFFQYIFPHVLFEEFPSTGGYFSLYFGHNFQYIT